MNGHDFELLNLSLFFKTGSIDPVHLLKSPLKHFFQGLAFLIKQGFVEDSPNVISNFLITRKVFMLLLVKLNLFKGISRQVIGEYLGNGSDRSKKILKAVCNQMDLSELDVDEALRKFQSSVRIQGEAQRVERLVEAFSQRYVESNPEIVRKLNNPDSIFVLGAHLLLFKLLTLYSSVRDYNAEHRRALTFNEKRKAHVRRRLR